MDFRLSEESIATVGDLGRVPIAFLVERVLEVAESAAGLGGLLLRERGAEPPYIKDYDAIAGEGPSRWARRFDISHWGFIAARTGGECVGGAVIAAATSGVRMLGDRTDLAVLWDLRVAPELRRTGVGAALFRAAEEWAAARGYRQLAAETQNINVPACRFYARQGCSLGAIDRHAYPGLPGETRLVWYRDLAA